MRLLIILIVLAIIGVLTARQLEKPAPEPATQGQSKDAPPRVPTRPQEVPKFQKDMNQYMEDQGKKQHDRIDRVAR